MGVTNALVTGGESVGGLVGASVSGATINNSYTTGEVSLSGNLSGQSSYLGGLVGV